MNKKNLSLVILFFCFLSGIIQAQQPEEKRMKIEISVKDGNKVLTAAARSVSFSYVKPAAAETDWQLKNASKNFYFSVDFEKLDIALLRAFTKNKSGLDGQITMTDPFGKTPPRKFEFTKASLDTFTDQLTAEYSSSYFSISCNSLIVDGVNIE